MVCLKCDWKRPKASNSTQSSAFEHRGQERQQHSRMMFVRSDSESYSQSWNRENETDFWSGGEDNDIGPGMKLLAVEDFPIAGGRRVVSQDPHIRDQWKEMVRRSKEVPRVREREGNDEMGPLPLHRRFNPNECSDGDEMGEWFGFAKNRRTAENN
ncbi:hypothetical protein ACLOJK_007102 [Asimina triloba]